MGEVIFCTTEDGSVGLYNENVKDIYHSSYGAHGEAVEKFIEASGFPEFIRANDSVRVLDICYGIGYNTKTALQEILNLEKTIEAHFDCLEYDKNLITISPLLKNQKIDNTINKFLIKNSNIKNLFNVFSVFDVLKYFFETRGLCHINWQNLILFSGFLNNSGFLLYPFVKLDAFLHNIYYKYVSRRTKKGQKSSKLNKTSLEFHPDDARKSVQSLSDKYNFIFLDAFTPKKLPTLWSLEFFKELYRLLDDNGVLVTYSSSAAVRAAMIDAGFSVGKSIGTTERSHGKIIGTVAAKNPALIKYELDDFERDLLATTAGVYFRDETLDTPAEKIIAQRDAEAARSNRMTSSRLKKIYAKK